MAGYCDRGWTSFCPGKCKYAQFQTFVQIAINTFKHIIKIVQSHKKITWVHDTPILVSKLFPGA